jgi:ParB family chromosome partitioning protein
LRDGGSGVAAETYFFGFANIPFLRGEELYDYKGDNKHMRKQINIRTNPLFNHSLNERLTSGNPYRELKLNDIDVDPNQPRRIFDEEAIRMLAETIKIYGVMNPITVRAIDGGTYRIVAGERRYRASILAGKKTIPAVIVSDNENDTKTTLSKQLIENIQREGLNPLERAEAIGKLRDQTSMSIRDIAANLGISKTMVQRSLEILDLPSDLKLALEQGKSESKILLLAKLESAELRKEFIDNIDDWTRVDLEEKLYLLNNPVETEVKVSHGGTKKIKNDSQVSVEDMRIIEELQRQLGTKVELVRKNSNKQQGKLLIDFYSDEILKGIYDRIVK